MENGLMESNMAKGFILQHQLNKEKVNGRKGKEFIGFQRIKIKKSPH